MTDDVTPRMFGHYRLDRVIATGGMGVVYEAYDTTTARTVALKCLPAEWSDDSGFRERFLKEVSVTAKLTEPHVIPVHHWGEIDGRLYLDMRKVDGQDLARILKSDTAPRDPGRAVHIVEQVATALDAAHASGLVHRDVKPANILIAGQSVHHDFAYLIDFGIANALADATSLTATGQVVGTPDYMAPERWRAGVPGYEIEDHRVDVYALGCVLYELVEGTRPFRGSSRDDIARAHLYDPVPPVESVPGEVGERLSEVLRRALAKSPSDRYASAGELATAALAAVGRSTPRRPAVVGASHGSATELGGTPPATAPPPAVAPVPARERSRLRPSRTVVVLGALALVAATTIGITLTTRTSSQPSDVTLFEQSLVDMQPGWTVGRSEVVDTGFRDGGYVVQPLDKSYAPYVEAPAPPETYVSDSTVTATATLRGGQGLWGVWCRGVDAQPRNAYLFLISHTAAVQITRTGFSDGTGWTHLDGVDVTQPVTISARCADVPNAPGGPVELTMTVNGRQVLHYEPKEVLSPGYAGVTAQPFGDVDGPIAAATFSDFRVSRPH